MRKFYGPIGRKPRGIKTKNSHSKAAGVVFNLTRYKSCIAILARGQGVGKHQNLEFFFNRFLID